MRKECLCIFLTLLSLMFALLFAENSQAQVRRVPFLMGEFLIEASTLSSGELGIDELYNLILSSHPNVHRINQLLVGRKFQGKGLCKVINRRLPVEFQDVELQFSPSNRTLRALSGSAKSVQSLDERDNVSYGFEGFSIGIVARTMIFKPKSAHGAMKITVPHEILADDQTVGLTLFSDHADIGANGSVFGANFKPVNSFSFQPRNSKYTFFVASQAHHTVNLGDIAEGDKGISIDGTATRGSIPFSFTAKLKGRPKEARYTLILSSPQTVEPECGYVLGLKKGEIVYQYAAGLSVLGPLSPLQGRDRIYYRMEPSVSQTTVSAIAGQLEIVGCEGEFVVDLTLPEKVLDENGQRIRIVDLLLRTDKSGNLFGKTSVPKFRVGKTFWIACEGDNGWVFFDNWAVGPRHYDCGKVIGDLESYCKKYTFPILDRADFLSRPGVSVFSGEFSFRAPQTPNRINKLHTKFWGNLTITPTGVAGNLTSSGYSLVPDDRPDTIIQYSDPKRTLQEIINKGDSPPEEPRELFQLSDLRILEMTVDSIEFCTSRIYSSSIKYDVHFPHPSYFSLEFADTSLDDDGLFHAASGPFTTTSVQITEEGISKADGKYEAEGRFLWFWRIPVVFHPGGVGIKHKISQDQKTAVTISNGDLAIPRLTSDKPVSPTMAPQGRQGVSFTGNLEPGGGFSFNQFEKSNWFGKGKGYETSFFCQLESITLANINEKPATRQNDLRWSGKIRFPFFGAPETDSGPEMYTPVSFLVRNLKCNLAQLLSLDRTRFHVRTPQISLQVRTENGLEYSFDNAGFFTHRAMYSKTGDPKEYEATLWMYSLTAAFLIPKIAAQGPIELHTSATTGECGRPKTVKQTMVDVVISPPDPVCHDRGAWRERNNLYGAETCNEPIYRGTYQVISVDQSSGKETTVLSIPNATYYAYLAPPLLTANHAAAEFTTDDNPAASSSAKKLSIPGAKLFYNPETGDIEGILSLSTDIGISLPVEGSANIMFSIQSQCGHFFFYGDVELTYYIGLGGQILISHTPFSRLETMQIGSSNPIAEIARWAYMDMDTDREEILNRFFGKINLQSGTVTGGLVAGRASFDIGIAGLGLGAGVWYFQNSRPNENEIEQILGAYIAARAFVDLCILQASLEGSLQADFQPSDEEIRAYGAIGGCICVSALIGHAQAEIDTGVWFSNRTGVTVVEPDPKFEMGWGGCGCI